MAHTPPRAATHSPRQLVVHGDGRRRNNRLHKAAQAAVLHDEVEAWSKQRVHRKLARQKDALWCVTANEAALLEHKAL